MADDNNPQGTVGQAASDAGMSGDDTDSRLDRLLGASDEDKGAGEEQETGKDASEDEGPDEAEEDADASETDDEEDDTGNEDEDQPSEGGRFVADDAKVRLADGQVVTVAELKSGSLRHADYTRKTQEIAENRRELQARQAEIAQRAQQAEQNLNFAIQMAQANLPQPPDPSVLNSDDPFAVMQYMKDKQAYDLRIGQVQQLLAAKIQQDQSAKAEQDQTLQGHVAAEKQRLLDALPELVGKTGRPDPAKIKALDDEIAEGIQHYGFSPEERHQVVDHRLILLARDAIRWRKLQAEKPKVLKKAAAKPVLKPAPQRDQKAARQRDWAKDKQRVRETGGRDSQALDRLLDNLIE